MSSTTQSTQMSDKNGTVEEKEKTRLFWKKEKELTIIDKN